MRAGRLRVIVLGYIIRGPMGGMTWHYLQYVLGLARLGHDVYFVEDSRASASCYDPSRGVIDADPTYGLGYAGAVFQQVGLGDRWAYYDEHRRSWHGPAAGVILERCATADLLLNVSAANPLRPWLATIPARVLVDTDPGFTQIRHLGDPAAMALAREHTSFFTFGENIHRRDTPVPDDGLPWQPTRQPITVEDWPVTPGPRHGKLTTIMRWDSRRAREFGGRRYGMKSESFRAFLDLPSRTGPVFELAIGSAGVPRQLLAAKGWALADPVDIARDPWIYQRFIQSSKAEFSIAKHGYVIGRTGWFSERSAAYLASGRPVVAQDTGFPDVLPAGLGVLSFGTPDEAITAIDDVTARYDVHCRAAREIAEEYFDAREVLGRLIDVAMAEATPPRPSGLPETLGA